MSQHTQLLSVSVFASKGIFALQEADLDQCQRIGDRQTSSISHDFHIQRPAMHLSKCEKRKPKKSTLFSAP
jgi:hypothetical protein